MMPNDNVSNRNDKKTIVGAGAHLVSSAIRHRRPNSTSLIEKPVLKHTSGKKARLHKVDSNRIETTSLSVSRAGKNRKNVPPDYSDKKFKKVTKENYHFIRYLLIHYNFLQGKYGKPSIKGSMYASDVTEDGNVTSAHHVKKVIRSINVTYN